VPQTAFEAFKILELGGHSGVTSGPAGKQLMEEIKKATDHTKLLKQI
jgi:hypothetical protein